MFLWNPWYVLFFAELKVKKNSIKFEIENVCNIMSLLVMFYASFLNESITNILLSPNLRTVICF